MKKLALFIASLAMVSAACAQPVSDQTVKPTPCTPGSVTTDADGLLLTCGADATWARSADSEIVAQLAKLNATNALILNRLTEIAAERSQAK
ncbi:hypothetical protein [Burkholderia territorii]|uniref:hypothetical protein n=1 Tax=Burkholderia territorii TaxID=1503055 RepID=UPI000752362D|nr:hypothetical protein [Burkholderia territorii]